MGETTITRETVLKDMQKVSGHFDTLGQGSELDRATQLVIQPIQILLRRLDGAKIVAILQLLYPGEEVWDLLPEAVQEVVRGRKQDLSYKKS